jgi:hypothetical protein
MKNNLLDEAIRLALAKRENHPMHKRGYKLFSFMVIKNKMIGYGVNNKDFQVPIHWGYDKRSRGWSNGFVPCIHAEVDCYRKYGARVRDSFELINVRVTDSNNIGMSKPCPCCCDWMRNNGCIGVHFTTNVGWARIAL